MLLEKSGKIPQRRMKKLNQSKKSTQVTEVKFNAVKYNMHRNL